jgi:hypothetical protein
VQFALRANRAESMRTWVRMRVRGLPAGARVEWRRQGRVVDHIMRRGGRKIRMRIYTSQTTPVGRYRLRVSARHKTLRVHRRVILRVRRVRIGVTGNLTALLSPGRVLPLDVTFTNYRRRPLHLERLLVGFDDRTSSPTCSAWAIFGVRQMPPMPLLLPPGDTRLSELVPASSVWPRIAMLNLPVSQDGCKNTTLTLRLSAEGRR